MVLGFILQPIHTLLNFQATNVAAVMNSIPQITRNGYPIQLIASKFLFYTSLASQFCHFIYFTKFLSVSSEFEMTIKEI